MRLIDGDALLENIRRKNPGYTEKMNLQREKWNARSIYFNAVIEAPTVHPKWNYCQNCGYENRNFAFEKPKEKWIVHRGNYNDSYECPNCHKENRDCGRFCAFCGVEVG